MAKKAKAKKRGVKPGTKRGRYKKPSKSVASRIIRATLDESKKWKVSEGTSLTLSLCEQLEETITRFENRISNSIGRLNELIGKF